MSASISARLVGREGLDLLVEVAEAEVRVDARLLQRGAVLLEHVLEEDRHGVAEHDGVGDLHHGGLEVQREQHALLLRVLDLLLVELAERADVHHRRVDDLAVQQGRVLLEDRRLPVGADELDPVLRRLLDRGGRLVAVEVVGGHVRDVRLRLRAPGAELVRVLLRERLHGERRAAVRVALAEHRVHGAAEALRVPRLDRLLGVVLRALGVVRDLVALPLQLLDRLLELRDRRADVRQLDDVRVRLVRELAELSQVVGDPLALGQVLGEVRDDPPSERDVPRLDVDARALGECLDDGKQRVRCKRRCFVDLGPDDLGGLRRHVPLPWFSCVHRQRATFTVRTRCCSRSPRARPLARSSALRISSGLSSSAPAGSGQETSGIYLIRPAFVFESGHTVEDRQRRRIRFRTAADARRGTRSARRRRAHSTTARRSASFRATPEGAAMPSSPGASHRERPRRSLDSSRHRPPSAGARGRTGEGRGASVSGRSPGRSDAGQRRLQRAFTRRSLQFLAGAGDARNAGSGPPRAEGASRPACQLTCVAAPRALTPEHLHVAHQLRGIRRRAEALAEARRRNRASPPELTRGGAP